MREGGLDRNQLRAAPIHRQLSATRDATCVAPRVDLSGLESRDLREIQDVVHVDARAGDLDPAEPVHGEVAERMSGRGYRQDECGKRRGADDESSHAAYLLRTGAHRTEKWGFSANALRNH